MSWGSNPGSTHGIILSLNSNKVIKNVDQHFGIQISGFMSVCTQDTTWNLVLWIWCSVSNGRSLDTNRLAAVWMSRTWSVVWRIIVMPSAKDLCVMWTILHRRWPVIPGDSKEVFQLQIKSRNVTCANGPTECQYKEWTPYFNLTQLAWRFVRYAREVPGCANMHSSVIILFYRKLWYLAAIWM